MRKLLLLVLISCAVAVGLSGSAQAGDYAFGQNVSPGVVAASDNSPTATQQLLVYGSSLAQADAAAGVSPLHELGLVGAESVEANASQAAALAAQPGVQYVTADVPMEATGTISAQSAVSAASLATIYPQVDGATRLWANGVTGAGVGIAIIDSGVTPRADFGSRLVQVQLPTQSDTSLNDSVGHGSAVAGVAAGDSPDGQYIGVAPGANIYAINVAQGNSVYSSDVIAGLLWVLVHAKQDNIRVVNLSLSETEPSSYLDDPLDAVCELLWRAGIVVVAAAGNQGTNGEDYAPANDPFVITVGASDDQDTLNTADDTLASFSSYGTTLDGIQKPDIVAPGMHIDTTIPADSEIAQSAPSGYIFADPNETEQGENTYARISGTSFSAPQVAGAAALLLQENPNLDPDQVKWLLTENERSLSGSNAGALALNQISSAALANPGSANQQYAWSSWGQPGEQTTGFTAAAWDAAAWDAAAWDAAAWDAAAWDAAAWDAAAWDAAAWDAAAWDAAAWDAVAWS